MTFSTDDEMERQMWVHKISQATGQSHRPVAPKTLETGTQKTNSLTKLLGGKERATFAHYSPSERDKNLSKFFFDKFSNSRANEAMV